MSDTPRTDALVDYEIRTGQSLGESSIYDLARQLERDLAAAQERIREQVQVSAKLASECACERLRAERAESALAQEREHVRSLVSDPIPESPLRDLGAWLADHLNDDQWNNCEANFLIPALAFLAQEREARRAAEKDAERYRWLLKQVSHNDFIPIAQVVWKQLSNPHGEWVNLINGADLDAHIDAQLAAIAGTK